MGLDQAGEFYLAIFTFRRTCPRRRADGLKLGSLISDCLHTRGNEDDAIFNIFGLGYVCLASLRFIYIYDVFLSSRARDFRHYTNEGDDTTYLNTYIEHRDIEIGVISPRVLYQCFRLS